MIANHSVYFTPPHKGLTMLPKQIKACLHRLDRLDRTDLTLPAIRDKIEKLTPFLENAEAFDGIGRLKKQARKAGEYYANRIQALRLAESYLLSELPLEHLRPLAWDLDCTSVPNYTTMKDFRPWWRTDLLKQAEAFRRRRSSEARSRACYS